MRKLPLGLFLLGHDGVTCATRRDALMQNLLDCVLSLSGNAAQSTALASYQFQAEQRRERFP
jgi:hypothetical protein